MVQEACACRRIQIGPEDQRRRYECQSEDPAPDGDFPHGARIARLADLTASIQSLADDRSPGAIAKTSRRSRKPEDCLAAARKELAGLDRKEWAIRKFRSLKALLFSTGTELARDATRTKLSALARLTARQSLDYNPGNPVAAHKTELRVRGFGTVRTAPAPAATRSASRTWPAAPRLPRRSSEWVEASFKAGFESLASPLRTAFAGLCRATSWPCSRPRHVVVQVAR